MASRRLHSFPTTHEPGIPAPPGRGLALVLAALALVPAAHAQEDPVGYHPVAQAIEGARIVTAPGSTIEKGTVVVRDGVIEAVGVTGQVAIPFDAKVIAGEGLVVYPGFIDLYTLAGSSPGVDRSATGAGRSIAFRDYSVASMPEGDRNGLTPEFRAGEHLKWPDGFSESRRKLGFTDLLAAPGGSIAAGQSALVSTGGRTRRESIVQPSVALHINLDSPTLPESLKDAGDPTSATFRPTGGYPTSLMGVVAHLRQAMSDAAYHAELQTAARAPQDPALDALHAARTGRLPVWWEADTREEIHRVLDLAREFNTTGVIVGGREAAKVLDRLKAERASVVLRLDFPEEPKPPTDAEYGKRKPAERDVPLRVLREQAERWKERVGTATALAKAGIPFALSTDRLEKIADFPDRLRRLIGAGLTPDAALAALSRDAASIAGVAGRLGTIERGKLGHLVALSAPLDSKEAKVRHVLVDGLDFDVQKGVKPDDEKKDEDKPEGNKKPDGEKAKEETKKAKDDEKPTSEPAAKPVADDATELDADRVPALRTGGSVLIRDAVVLTGTAAGTIPRASILVRDGKIAAIGADLDAPEGVAVIEANGLVAMPGIIDSHSHMAISGGVNEMSLSVVPEVRVRDVIDGKDEGLYRALAGGVTTSRLLHGSANAIGGQDAVVKHRYGRAGRDLLLDDPKRPTGVKFALGENVTRRQDRFPTTRMGVEAVLQRSFDEARAYRDRLRAHRSLIARGEPHSPFRRDLRLEALASLLEGSFKIHSHCYRSDEILMLLRLAERNDLRVQSLQHVLEGYKVAPEIAAHGASASTFSDWWAYKVEAYDAIPYNAALLTEAGTSVCIKSDSDELVRHLYHEAAKMVRYGGVSEAAAIAMITINPARELGLDHRLGSLEAGKDADIALFNAHPFDAFTRCELTLVDGEVAYQRKLPSGKPSPRSPEAGRMPRPDAELLSRRVELPARNERGLYALTGATVHPVSGPAIENGTVVIEAGKIAAVGGPETAIPPGAATLDLRGLEVWPGLIDASSLVGLTEIGSLRETQDYSDSARYQPELRSSSALHPDSALVAVTRANGVLAAFVQPTGGVIAGQGCVASLAGWVPAEMIAVDPVALVVNVPPYSVADPERPRPRDRPDPNKDRQKALDDLTEPFREALAYDRVVQGAKAKGTTPPVPDPRLEALVPYARGEKPVVFRANGRHEILDALDLARELKLKAVISGGLEAWKVAGAIKEAGVPVILTGVLRLPARRYDPTDAPYENAGRLHEAGIPLAIAGTVEGADPATSSRNIPFEAAFAVAHGLPETAALEAVTLAPARILGVADQLGSIEPGKRANLVVTAGPILQITSEVKALFVNGKAIEPTSRHTALYQAYRQRLQDVRAGRAALGLDRPAPGPAATAPAGGGR